MEPIVLDSNNCSAEVTAVSNDSNCTAGIIKYVWTVYEADGVTPVVEDVETIEPFFNLETNGIATGYYVLEVVAVDCAGESPAFTQEIIWVSGISTTVSAFLNASEVSAIGANPRVIDNIDVSTGSPTTVSIIFKNQTTPAENKQAINVAAGSTLSTCNANWNDVTNTTLIANDNTGASSFLTLLRRFAEWTATFVYAMSVVPTFPLDPINTFFGLLTDTTTPIGNRTIVVESHLLSLNTSVGDIEVVVTNTTTAETHTFPYADIATNGLITINNTHPSFPTGFSQGDLVDVTVNGRNADASETGTNSATGIAIL